MIEAEEEPNKHGNEWLKAMNREKIYSEVQETKEKYQNPERKMKYTEKKAVKQEKSRTRQRVKLTQ